MQQREINRIKKVLRSNRERESVLISVPHLIFMYSLYFWHAGKRSHREYTITAQSSIITQPKMHIFDDGVVPHACVRRRFVGACLMVQNFQLFLHEFFSCVCEFQIQTTHNI